MTATITLAFLHHAAAFLVFAALMVELVLLRRTLERRIGALERTAGYAMRLFLAAAVAAGVGWGLKVTVGIEQPVVRGLVILGSYGITFLGVTRLLGIREAASLLRRIARRR